MIPGEGCQTWGCRKKYYCQVWSGTEPQDPVHCRSQWDKDNFPCKLSEIMTMLSLTQLSPLQVRWCCHRLLTSVVPVILVDSAWSRYQRLSAQLSSPTLDTKLQSQCASTSRGSNTRAPATSGLHVLLSGHVRVWWPGLRGSINSECLQSVLAVTQSESYLVWTIKILKLNHDENISALNVKSFLPSNKLEAVSHGDDTGLFEFLDEARIINDVLSILQ